MDLLSPFHFEDEPAPMPGEAPLLILPETVLLPGEPLSVVLPPGAVSAAEAALAGDRLVALACAKRGTAGKTETYPVAALGRIVSEEADSDGGINSILLGLKRIRLGTPVQETPFPKIAIETLEDRFSQTASNLLTGLESEILGRLDRILNVRPMPMDGPLALPLDQLVPGALPLGMLCDLAAAAAALGAQEKQLVLEEADVVRRAEKVVFCLQFLLDSFRVEKNSRTLH